jgi:hypothetical protein
MKANNWKRIIAFALPRYKAADPVPKFQPTPKIQAKLEELEKEKGITWTVFMAE